MSKSKVQSKVQDTTPHLHGFLLLGSPQHTLHPKLPRLLPLPFRRGEGWGEGLLGVVYPADLSVTPRKTAGG